MTVLLVVGLLLATVFAAVMWAAMILALTDGWRKRLAWWTTERWARKHGYSESEIAKAKRQVRR